MGPRSQTNGFGRISFLTIELAQVLRITNTAPKNWHVSGWGDRIGISRGISCLHGMHLCEGVYLSLHRNQPRLLKVSLCLSLCSFFFFCFFCTVYVHTARRKLNLAKKHSFTLKTFMHKIDRKGANEHTEQFGMGNKAKIKSKKCKKGRERLKRLCTFEWEERRNEK